MAWNSSTAVYPVKLYGIVPAGTAWNIPVSQDKNTPTINWVANIAAGTQFVLLMSDAGKVGTGGSTPLLTVQQSNDNTCLNSGSPSTTPVVTPSSTGTSATSSSAPTNTAGGAGSAAPAKKGKNVWTIVGPILAVVLALLILALVLLWCRSRRRQREADKPGMTPLAMEERDGRPGILDGGLDTPSSAFTPGFTPTHSPGHSRFNSRTTNNRNSWGDSNPSASVHGAYEGQPRGAQAPSLLTDGPEEHFELHPFPFEEQGTTSSSSHQPRNSGYTTESGKLEAEYARGRAAGHTRLSESTSGPRTGPSPQGEWETSL